MNLCRICTVFFSPTGGTKQSAQLLSDALADALGVEQTFLDLTSLSARKTAYHFAPDELVIVASPVYAGRIPNKIAPDFAACLQGDCTPAIPVCVFGNRSPGDAVRELALLLESNGFTAVAAASLVCRHAFSDTVGTGRPDAADKQEITHFARKVSERLRRPEIETLSFDRKTPIAPYYTPLREDGTPAKFLKATPQRTDACTGCGRCAALCPMGSIAPATLDVKGICIK